MPIPRSRLSEASRPLRERLLEVLRADPDNAYSVVELRAMLERLTPMDVMLSYAMGRERWPAEYDGELRALVEARKVVMATVNGTAYYSIALKDAK